jgi:hypothetical protein
MNRARTAESAVLALVLALSLSACADDPVVGKWEVDGEPAAFVELRSDGSLLAPIDTIDPTCEDAGDVIAACRRRQSWSHRGDRYVFALGSVLRRASLADSIDRGRACTCHLETAAFSLHGDTLTADGASGVLRRVR